MASSYYYYNSILILIFPQNLLEDGRAGEPEAEVGGEAGPGAGGGDGEWWWWGGQEEFLRLLQVNLDQDVRLQQEQRIPQLWTEDN